MTDHLLSPQAVAELKGRTRTCVCKAIRRGDLAAVRIVADPKGKRLAGYGVTIEAARAWKPDKPGGKKGAGRPVGTSGKARDEASAKRPDPSAWLLEGGGASP